MTKIMCNEILKIWAFKEFDFHNNLICLNVRNFKFGTIFSPIKRSKNIMLPDDVIAKCENW